MQYRINYSNGSPSITTNDAAGVAIALDRVTQSGDGYLAYTDGGSPVGIGADAVARWREGRVLVWPSAEAADGTNGTGDDGSHAVAEVLVEAE